MENTENTKPSPEEADALRAELAERLKDVCHLTDMHKRMYNMINYPTTTMEVKRYNVMPMHKLEEFIGIFRDRTVNSPLMQQTFSKEIAELHYKTHLFLALWAWTFRQ